MGIPFKIKGLLSRVKNQILIAQSRQELVLNCILEEWQPFVKERLGSEL